MSSVLYISKSKRSYAWWDIGFMKDLAKAITDCPNAQLALWTNRPGGGMRELTILLTRFRHLGRVGICQCPPRAGRERPACPIWLCHLWHDLWKPNYRGKKKWLSNYRNFR